jgi:hypothetical protein
MYNLANGRGEREFARQILRSAVGFAEELQLLVQSNSLNEPHNSERKRSSGLSGPTTLANREVQRQTRRAFL